MASPRIPKERTKTRNRVYLYHFKKKQLERDGLGPAKNRRGAALTSNRISVLGKFMIRYSCANHKNNLAVRKAFESNEDVAFDFTTMSKFVREQRKTISTCRLMIGLKVRLQINSKTRFLAGFIMCSVLKKAYERGTKSIRLLHSFYLNNMNLNHLFIKSRKYRKKIMLAN